MVDTPQEQETEAMAEEPIVEIVEVPSARRRSLVSEFKDYLLDNKKWWMIPILVMIALFMGLFILVQAAPLVTPFIYPLL